MKPIRNWRVMESEDRCGFLVWFDPRSELLTLRDLTADEKSVILDRHGSVSDLIRFDQPGEVDTKRQDHRSDPSFFQLNLFGDSDHG